MKDVEKSRTSFIRVNLRVLREKHLFQCPLVSYGFLFPKACGGVGGDVGGHWLPFLFANNIGFHLSVGRTEVRPTSLRMAIFISVAFPADLLRDEKALNC